MEEEEDKLLLSSLGVTSANPEDIERDVLTEVKNEAGGTNEVEENTDMQFLGEEQRTEPSATARDKIFNKLRAVQVEIDAVAASVKQTRNSAINEDDTSVGTEGELEDLDSRNGIVQDSNNGLKLQHALAADRLRSLKKTKAQLQKDLKELTKNDNAKDAMDDKLLDKLVREETKQKARLEEVDHTRKSSKKRQKSLALDEDIDFEAMLDAASAGFVETERDELIRKGVLTPFHKIKGFERRLQQSEPSNIQEELKEDSIENHLASTSIAKAIQSNLEVARARPTTKLLDAKDLPKLEAPTHPFRRLKPPLKLPGSPGSEKSEDKNSKPRKRKRPLPDKRWRKATSKEDNLFEGADGGEDSIASDNEGEIQDTDFDEPVFVTLEGGLKIPETIFSQLFDYQKVGVQWLWELHCQRAGGIIGDEMGLGKTIQVLSFLGALHFSKMFKPSIVICPVTLLRQWKREAQKWYPSFHVEILHDSAQIPDRRRKQAKSDETEEEADDSLESDDERNMSNKACKKWDFLIDRVLRSESGLLITSYEQLRILGEKLLDIEWGYAVLDEGHRIRNPNAEITLVCKQLQTVHRIIMTGAPIQNKLSELWSLFDFVFPGKLGVLPVFETEFAVPISVGGYANATPLQVSTAYRCAVVLRDLIMPYLLRRMKADVNAQLPKKTEHVLFCSLTAEQRSAYRAFLASSEVEQIFDGNRNSLYGIDIMRKICNHPDLLEREHCANNPDYGNPVRSGKMKVVEQVLKVWKGQGHSVLLFTQTQQMLDIIENFLLAGGYTYRRMDGLTPVKQRTSLIDEFNNSTEVFIFILTTKVGGLGTNLTGANRVIIFDPDWNPSTDMQARERAWRIGQKRDVVVYRLITRGTIEEKVYHRQIYKHFLTNKILKNPQQKRFFKARDLRDLFVLQDDGESVSTETSNIFAQLADDLNLHSQENKLDETGLSAVTMQVNGGLCEKTSSEHHVFKGKEKVDASDGEVDEETNILRSLFDAQGIHSAVNHDAIMSANDGEKMRLEEQASQVAKKAADALRQSRMLCSQENVSVPTWTGRAGTAGAPASLRKKFGSTVNAQLLSSTKPTEGTSSSGGISKPNGFAAGASTGRALTSAELLSKIRGTQERAAHDALEHQSASGSNHFLRPPLGAGTPKFSHKNLLEPDIMVEQLITFIKCLGGTARSTDIVKHFKDKVPSDDLSLFKDLLKEIASLKKDSSGSTWVLKPEYQQ